MLFASSFFFCSIYSHNSRYFGTFNPIKYPFCDFDGVASTNMFVVWKTRGWMFRKWRLENSGECFVQQLHARQVVHSNGRCNFKSVHSINCIRTSVYISMKILLMYAKSTIL